MQALSDIKNGFYNLKRTYLGIVLSMVMAIALFVVVLLLAALPASVILLLVAGGDFFGQILSLVLFWEPLLRGNVEIVISSGFLSVLLPIVLVYIWTFGAMYGVSKEIVDSNAVRVTSFIHWFRSHILGLLGTGVLLALIAIGPPLSIAAGLSMQGVTAIPFPADWVFGLLSFAWFFIVICFSSMQVPALMDGLGVFAALRESANLVRANLSRVFSVHLLYFLVLVLLFGPLPIYSVITNSFDAASDAVAAAILSWSAFGLFILGFALLPSLYITMTTIYRDLKLG
ncbi:MAG: hypothetical protein JSW61_01685 [Candidatus Thorarchaeota archaeon]|nr:MAG: hypothetical protein JSW61_01685 [Candidatus Thorarchaeota archaeon]